MPTGHIDLENVNNTWIIQVEASSFMATKRRTIKAATVDEAFDIARRTYAELSDMVRPKSTPKEDAAVQEQIAANAEQQRQEHTQFHPTKRGRHPKDCMCERCVVKREAATALALNESPAAA